MYSLTTFLLSLPLLSLAGHGSPSFGHQHRRHAVKARSTNYTLEDWYQGESFFNEWNFFSGSDPTNGLVSYQSMDSAKSKGLAYVQPDGTTVLAVDNYTELSSGASRNSVRIGSNKAYNGGLFIADFFAMPHGCSLWPAYWSVGGDWPTNGEIDIIEGVNKNTNNQMTLHSSAGCAIESSLTSLVRANSSLGNLDCATGNTNTGCIFFDNDERSYGHGFNMQAGGVFAHEWTNDAIKIWFFSRNEIPSDITNKSPNPSTWGEPSAVFNNNACDISEHFKEHTLTIDTTLCGDWAGGAFSSSGCGGSCADAVADPTNYDNARWMINYVASYQTS